MKLLLDLGSGGGSSLPVTYQGWKRVRLDLDPLTKPDVLADARNLTDLVPATFDAVVASHLIEHFTRADALHVLAGCLHVLRDGGTLELRCPDIGNLLRRVMAMNMDLEDFLYQSPAGPIRPADMLWGFQAAIEASGKDYMAHRYGYTSLSLYRLLQEAGFASIVVESVHLELTAVAKKGHIQ